MEYCDQGTLRQALDRGRLKNPRSGHTHLPTALALVRDVAAAMQYLHQQQVVHGDLKASNVLLKTAYMPKPSSTPPLARGRRARDGDSSAEHAGGASTGANLIQGGWVVAKICDFGLSSFLDTAGASTALSTQICGGTFGILLYEVLTSERPYARVPHAMLGHAVVARRQRPAWPAALGAESLEARKLAEACWAHNPQARPSFRDIVDRLQALHDAALAGAGAHSSADSGSCSGGGGGSGASCFQEACAPAAAGAQVAAAGQAAPSDGVRGGERPVLQALPLALVSDGGGSSGGGLASGAGSSAAPAAGACAVVAAPGDAAGANNRSSIIGWL